MTKKAVKVQQVPWVKIYNNVIHVVLLLGSAYVASNPEAMWMAPFLQAMGQGMHSPK